MELNEEQKQVIQCNQKYQQVIAGAGSGKTHTMISLVEHSVRNYNEREEDILVITFSRKAAAEIRERLEKRIGKNQVMIKTFHAYCLYIIQKYHPQYSNSTIRMIDMEEKESFFRAFFQKDKFLIGGIPYEFLLNPPKNFLEKNFPTLKGKLESTYSDYKKENNKLDFDDLVSIYLESLKNQDDWAEKAKKEVKRVIVDEFQDTDMTQLEWLKLLNPEKLTVVGDDWQAIYGFRGATTVPFLKFKDIFNPCELQYLNTNYRSLPDIVKISSIPISKNKNNIPKKVRAYRTGKSKISKLLLDDTFNLHALVKLLVSKNPKEKEIMVLCRSNHRISEYLNFGFPAENIMTIHASKGLEFKTVFVDLFAGWNIQLDEDKELIEEERRILYVGLSRAKDNLFLVGNSKKRNKKTLEEAFMEYFRFKVPKLNPYQLENSIG